MLDEEQLPLPSPGALLAMRLPRLVEPRQQYRDRGPDGRLCFPVQHYGHWFNGASRSSIIDHGPSRWIVWGLQNPSTRYSRSKWIPKYQDTRPGEQERYSE